jgi:hypothetical protein
MITLDQARISLAKYAGNGLYPDDPDVVDYINLAIERMMNKPKLWSFTTRNLILCAPNGQITMPREVAKIIKGRINGSFADVQSRWFEYYSNGPGLLEDKSSYGSLNLEDRGFVPLQYDIPHGLPMKLCVVTDRAEDEGKSILFRGKDETGREIYGSTLFGEYLPLKGGTQDEMWISKATFSTVDSIEKPVTKGYVYVSAIEPESGIRYFLGSLHPDETNPHYRRYFALETPCSPTLDSAGNPVVPTPFRIDALCKLQYIPAVHGSDILLIQNLGALKMMMIALRMEDAEKLDAAAKYEATAERLMSEQTENLENQETTIEIDSSFNSLGYIPELI